MPEKVFSWKTASTEGQIKVYNFGRQTSIWPFYGMDVVFHENIKCYTFIESKNVIFQVDPCKRIDHLSYIFLHIGEIIIFYVDRN